VGGKEFREGKKGVELKTGIRGVGTPPGKRERSWCRVTGGVVRGGRGEKGGPKDLKDLVKMN